MSDNVYVLGNTYAIPSRNEALKQVPWKLSVYAIIILAVSSCTLDAAEYVLPEVNIEGKQPADKTTDTVIGTKNVTTSSDIQLFDSAELISPYKAISREPGVDIRFNDPFGMDITHKIRGKSDRNIGETLEGLPLKGIGPGGGLSSMMDIENIESITVEKGAVKADSGFGYGSDNGMVDMHMKAPSNELGVALKQSFGSDDFRKTYMRVDSGEVSDSAKFFFSASTSDADKWKGEGKGLDRQNLEFGAASTSDQAVQWELYGIYNDQQSHNYKGLTYEQSKNLSLYKKLDYDTTHPLSGSYYDYNRLDYETYAIFGKVEIPLSNDDALSFRPYFLNDKGTSWSSNTSGITQWLVDHDTYGMILEYANKIEDGKIKVGYWFQEDEPPGPPTTQKLRYLGTNAFNKWSRLVDPEDNSLFHAPYIAVEKAFDNTIVEAGVKYLWWSTPTLTAYNTAGIGDVSADEALSKATNKLFTLNSETYGIFLPNIGATHYLDDHSYLRANYGRNYNTPQYGLGGSILTIYNSTHNKALVQQMWSDLQPEESDNFDVGYGYATGAWKIDTTLFFSSVKNVAGNFYDPDINLVYSQNIAKARSFGAELASSYHLLENLDLTMALTYNQYEFTEDVQTTASKIIRSKGKQIPDVPKWFGNVSAVYDLYGYKLSPVLRYLGKRYAEIENNYSVDPYWLLDFSINKEYALGGKNKLELSLSAINLLNKEYISTISTEDTSDSTSNATYIVGAPRSIFFSIGYKY